MALQQTPPNLIGQPDIYFRKSDFDATIWNKGYGIQIEKAVMCPCRGADNTPLTNCNNCHNTGYFFINPFTARATISNINSETKTKEWSLEKAGNLSFTIISPESDNEKPSFSDRVTLLGINNQGKPYGTVSETKILRKLDDNPSIVFLAFSIQEILDVWIFVNSESQLTKVDPSKYSISPDNSYTVIIDESVNPSNNVVTVRYKHDLQYLIVDIPHEVRQSLKTNSDGQQEVIQLPLQFIGKRVNFAMRSDADGGNLNDNSYR